MMKSFLLSSILALALAGSAEAKGFYVGAYGGANWDNVIDVPFVKENTGTVIGGVVGTTIDAVPGLRVEADLNYRQNDVDIFGGVITANDETWGLLGNVVWDIPALQMGRVQPYVLAGAGYANHTATFEDISVLELSHGGVAWQLGAGANYKIADNVSLGVGYRYFQGPNLEVLGTELSDGSNHSVIATVNFAF